MKSTSKPHAEPCLAAAASLCFSLDSHAAPFLVKVGEKEAIAGDVEDAILTFKTALKWNPKLKFDPYKKVKKFENKGKAEHLVN